MGFGTLLKELLSEKNMSIKELSEVTGIPINTLYSITKRDTVNVRPETLEKISAALDIPANDIIKKLKQNILATQEQLSQLQHTLEQAEKKQQFMLRFRYQLMQSLNALTNYSFSDSEIDTIIATAILIKEKEDNQNE